MNRTTWLAGIAVASLLLTGCASSAAVVPENAEPEASHTMPDGAVMPGSEHEGHHAGNAEGPSEAAQMICAGQVVAAVREILALADDPSPTSGWDAPMFNCTYEVDGMPLVLSVHDATDLPTGEEHFAELRDGFGSTREIEGLASLGLPAFSTGDGVVAFLRDGKTLLVDATALPDELGVKGTQSRHDAAYAVASAVLVCWVEHD
ncbi:hypothetical protein ACFFGH_10585 [Lysobacter korlensis]|uniref:DUF3558 domain-containing protein n=1 Tax=Lysobacter korlensis TaxID=553636 RepID=A0ABV6RNA8_9GAMM